MKPYSSRTINAEMEYFNSRHSLAHRYIECAFGMMTSKWRLLWKPTESGPDFVDLIVKAICVLHEEPFHPINLRTDMPFAVLYGHRL